MASSAGRKSSTATALFSFFLSKVQRVKMSLRHNMDE